MLRAPRRTTCPFGTHRFVEFCKSEPVPTTPSNFSHFFACRSIVPYTIRFLGEERLTRSSDGFENGGLVTVP